MAPEEHNNGLREQPMGELVKDLSGDLSSLVRNELRLAQAEMAEKGKKAGVGIGMLGGAALIAVLALAALTACLIAALSTAIEVWIAALIVTVGYGGAAGVLALKGRERLTNASPPVPEQTIESVKENAQWAKTRLSSEER